MIGDIVGYCTIKKNSASIITAGDRKDYEYAFCLRVLEINEGGDVLCLAPDGKSIASVNGEDVKNIFKCSTIGECILPPNLSDFEKFLYVEKLINRTGGYNSIIKSMVIAASLHSGKYTDDFLFQKQYKNY